MFSIAPTPIVSRVLPAVLALVCGFATAGRCQGETISAAAYTIDIRNGLTLSGNPGDPVSRLTSGRMSVLQRMSAASKPCITITNVSEELALTAFQVDLSNSASRVTSVQWLEAPGRTGWNWDAASLSAFFQFFDPLLPGESATMKLSTAAQPGREMDYKMNQTLLHPCIGDCLVEQEGFGVLTMYSVPADAATAVRQSVFGPDGRVMGDGVTALTLNLGDYPLTQEQIANPSTASLNVVSVPEPGTIALAASACVAIAGASLGRRGRRQQTVEKRPWRQSR